MLCFKEKCSRMNLTILNLFYYICFMMINYILKDNEND